MGKGKEQMEGRAAVEKTEPKRKVSDRGKYSNQAYPILSVIKDSQ